MKRLTFNLLLTFSFLPWTLGSFCLAQNTQIDTLKYQLLLSKDDSSRIMIMHRIGYDYETINVDSALKYDNGALYLARQRSYVGAEADLMASIAGVMKQQGKLPEALELLFKSLKIAEENNIPYSIARAYRRLGTVYYDLENFPRAIAYLLKALQIDEEKKRKGGDVVDLIFLGYAYEKMNKLDSAAFYINIAVKEKDLPKDVMQDIYEIEGNIKLKKGDYEQAAFSYNEGLQYAQRNSDLVSSSKICADISTLYVKLNRKDSAILYALKGFNYGKVVSFKKGIMLNGSLLAELYESSQPSEAFKYYKIAATAKESLFGVNNFQAIQNLVSTEEAKQKELEDAEVAYHNRLRLYGLLTGLIVVVVIAFILFRNNLQRKKANVVLQEQNQKIENTLSELKSTQAQLIQSEKMASLGELTAGIAHEIQNPLNFVNNFSEVNKELISELVEEVNKGNIAEVKAIANDIKDNEEKINHHGKRADVIVKGMLQHSRQTSGTKEPTDINKLADEYLRLSYHGLRAKDKTLNATIKTDFDTTLEKVNIIPQDIGRVLLNLYNNAFYAVKEKKQKNIDGYEPTVSISTKKIGDKIEISVKDNGDGVSQKVVDKIFQPFFTTKPTGQGTGLGLSLSYDIVKAHGGELKVETKEGVFSEFGFTLPV